MKKFSLRTLIFNLKNLFNIFLLSLILLFACNKDDGIVTPTPESKSIIPLSIGNKWLGMAERLGASGNFISDSPDSIIIIGNTLVDSNYQYILRTANGLLYNCANTDSGLVYYHYNGDYLQFKFPGKVGDIFWTAGNAFKEIISVDTTITTEFGSFSCYHFSQKYTTSPFHTEYFVSPNNGYIYIEHYQADGLAADVYLYSRIRYRPILKK